MKYRILNKNKKFYWTANSIFSSIIFITALPVFIKILIFESSKLTTLDEILMVILCISFIIGIVVGFSKIGKFVTLKGELNSELEFLFNSVKINEREILLEKVQKIEINAFDFKGAYASSKNLDGTFSNGVNNTIKIYLIDGTKTEVFFQQIIENQIRNEKQNLINYCNQGKLHYLNLLEMLGINNYEEIQNFKKEYLTIIN